MTPEQAAAISAAYERNVLGPLSAPDTPPAFYWRERWGPELTSDQLWRTVHELTMSSDAPRYTPDTTADQT